MNVTVTWLFVHEGKEPGVNVGQNLMFIQHPPPPSRYVYCQNTQDTSSDVAKQTTAVKGRIYRGRRDDGARIASPLTIFKLL